MMRLNIVGLGGLHFSRVEVQAPIRVTFVTEAAPGALVLGNQSCFFLFLGMALSATIVLERTLARQERQTDLLSFAQVFMAIDAISSCTTRPIFAHLHAGLQLRGRLEMNSLVVVNIVLSARHGERNIENSMMEGKAMVLLMSSKRICEPPTSGGQNLTAPARRARIYEWPGLNQTKLSQVLA